MVVTRGAAKGTSIQLGKLTVGEPLGAGGFGVVHKATLNPPVSEKLSPPPRSGVRASHSLGA